MQSEAMLYEADFLNSLAMFQLLPCKVKKLRTGWTG